MVLLQWTCSFFSPQSRVCNPASQQERLWVRLQARDLSVLSLHLLSVSVWALWALRRPPTLSKHDMWGQFNQSLYKSLQLTPVTLRDKRVQKINDEVQFIDHKWISKKMDCQWVYQSNTRFVFPLSKECYATRLSIDKLLRFAAKQLYCSTLSTTAEFTSLLYPGDTLPVVLTWWVDFQPRVRVSAVIHPEIIDFYERGPKFLHKEKAWCA